MGGTSTDVSHFAGRDVSDCERAFETQVAGVRMRAPMMSIHTVAAGGGSILHFDGARLRVGPDSAGANPGPACYRRGGPLTVTDCNVMVGKIQPAFFPAVFGRHGNEALDDDIVREKFAALAMEVEDATGRALTPEQLADGYLDIAVGNMAEAIKRISIQRGHDVTQYTLSVFGGAGGQHACRVADALGMTRIFVHPLAGVLSAYGMGLADQTAMREQSIESRLDAAAMPALAAALDRLAAEATGDLLSQGVGAQRITVVRRVHLRYEGTDSALIVAASTLSEMRAAFNAEYLKRYSFLMEQRGLVIEAVSVEAIGQGEAVIENTAPQVARSVPLASKGTAQLYSEGAWRAAPLYARSDMRPDDVIQGPAIIAEANATTVVEPDWEGTVTELDHVVLERVRAREERRAIGTDADPDHARSLQQPVHVDRRADGIASAEHRVLGQHQGAT